MRSELSQKIFLSQTKKPRFYIWQDFKACKEFFYAGCPTPGQNFYIVSDTRLSWFDRIYFTSHCKFGKIAAGRFLFKNVANIAKNRHKMIACEIFFSFGRLWSYACRRFYEVGGMCGRQLKPWGVLGGVGEFRCLG